MIICPPDCPKRKQGCHSQCENYKEKIADYRARRDWLDKDREARLYALDSIRKRLTAEAIRKSERRRYGKVRKPHVK